MFIHNRINNRLIYVALNAYWESLDFELPPVTPKSPWKMVLNTTRQSPEDITPYHKADPVSSPTVKVGPRSLVALVTEHLDPAPAITSK